MPLIVAKVVDVDHRIAFCQKQSGDRHPALVNDLDVVVKSVIIRHAPKSPCFSHWCRWLSVQPKTAWKPSWRQHRGIVLGTWIRRQIGGSISRSVIFSSSMDGLGLAVGMNDIVLQV